MDTVYPVGASALARGRRLRRGQQRARTRTQPVTFAEIKEVDEDEPEEKVEGSEERAVGRKGRDELGTAHPWRPPDWPGLEPPAAAAAALLPLHRQFVDSRRRRARRDVIPEPPEESSQARACSEPRAQSNP